MIICNRVVSDLCFREFVMSLAYLGHTLGFSFCVSPHLWTVPKQIMFWRDGPFKPQRVEKYIFIPREGSPTLQINIQFLFILNCISFIFKNKG